ncbi:carbohydrate ABC transporter permease [Mordavella massiliensis]|uniref:Sugar ABC transporter permease n=1 Tax=Mordavella massiliensis TaxID=1871024 RepID=A0A939BF84_9CLOT|nr:sugar ABC transporter permease [Mordavella massiliensis]MBM6947153.1 sugar ABC transporter permease [Mordavella massiliensis]
MKQNKKMIVCFLTPALFFFIVMYLYPIIRTIIMSFFNVEGVSDPMSEWSFNGIGNYQKLIETQLFRTSMMNMLKIFIIGGIAVMLIALLFAVILTSGVRFKAFWRAVIYVPNIINAVAIATMWIQYVFNKRFGLLHSFFTALGLEDLASIDYMNGKWKFWSLLIAFCFGSVGYFMLIFISGIERIPADYYEAATIDGANKLKQFSFITLPLIKGVFKTCTTFWTIAVIGFFVWSQMWASPQPSDNATITPVVYMYNAVFGTTGSTSRDAGVGAAVGILMAVIVLVVFGLVNLLVKDDDLEF